MDLHTVNHLPRPRVHMHATRQQPYTIGPLREGGSLLRPKYVGPKPKTYGLFTLPAGDDLDTCGRRRGRVGVVRWGHGQGRGKE